MNYQNLVIILEEQIINKELMVKKILFYIGIKKDIYEGEVVKEIKPYMKIKKYLSDGTWQFIWEEDKRITILKEF